MDQEDLKKDMTLFSEQENIEFLTNISQVLWREPSFERFIHSFVSIQKEHFKVKAAEFLSLVNIKGKYQLDKSAIEARGLPTLDAPVLDAFKEEVLQLNLKNQEYRQGVNTLFCGGKDVFFALLGDPASEWNVLIWQFADGKIHDRLRMNLDFLVRQVQSGCFWFNRLDKTQALLYKDDLTGLFNIRYLDIALDSEIRRASRFQTAFSLLFIDLDNFKSVNDQYGHLTGSSVLKQLADVLRNAAREVDSVTRYGGDEFIIILLGANSTTGLLAGERIRRIIEKNPFEVEVGHTISLTASIGVATYPEHATSKSELLSLADRNMYEGKRGGKNKVVIVNGGREVDA
jgi:diguanylate cyclase (GGDEF)-like protein